MKIESTTFLCDARGCHVEKTICEGVDATTAAYLALVDAGWKVKRSYTAQWKHYCPLHLDDSEPTS